jgi:hypothetical protein
VRASCAMLRPVKRDQQKPRGGAWFQKTAISYIDIPFEHQLSQLNDGWRLTAVTTGTLTVHLADGHRQAYELIEGDFIASTGPEMYLSYGSIGPIEYQPEQQTPEQQAPEQRGGHHG